MAGWLILLFVLLLYIVFEVNYFIRTSLLILCVRCLRIRKSIYEKCLIYGICLPSDIDIFLYHKNNARYLRELDFTRYYFYDITRLWAEVQRRGGTAFQVATSIRYRRAIRIFSMYKITTELIYWDDKHTYIKHEFISLSDNFVCASVLSKQRYIGTNMHVPDIIETIEPNARRPEPSTDLKLWLDFLEESSLRNKSSTD